MMLYSFIKQKYIIGISFPHRCEIETIEDEAYEGLHQLSTLILTGNPIQSLSQGSFFGLASLQNLVAVEISL